MAYTLYQAFVGYVTYMEHFRNIDNYRIGAKVIREGLPEIDKSQIGWRNIMEVKNFCETILTEEDTIVNMIAQDDGAATIEALTDESKKTMMLNPDDIARIIFQKS